MQKKIQLSTCIIFVGSLLCLMNILIVGYGEMGRHVETVLTQRKHKIVGKVDPVCGDYPEITKELAAKADVAIEFSIPKSALANIELYTRFGLNAVMATTGWFEHLDKAKNLVNQSGIGFIYGSNYSIGAHLFFRLVAKAAQIVNPFPQYDIMGYEIHHNRKKDSPSGTALSTAQVILDNCERKTKLVVDKLDRAIEKDELHFASIRGGDVPGVHKVLLDSNADTIEISHTARNRVGFAQGSVVAAEWLHGKKGFFTVDDFFKELL